MKSWVDRTLSYEELIQRIAAERRAREFSLAKKREAEDRTITETPGQGCGHCIDGLRSCPSMGCEIDLCNQMERPGVYLPVNIDLNNQRPVWCPGFTAVEIVHEKHEQHETEHQEELPL